ncbi:MAG: EAL domain-containing protein [Acetobacteraceae bacterium]|nr:EAL domain-containing protein [Acetobacteraceae bacterium]
MSDLLAMEAGLKNGEFFLEYLPIVALDSNRCVGAEALTRWRRPWGIAQPRNCSAHQGDAFFRLSHLLGARTDCRGLLELAEKPRGLHQLQRPAGDHRPGRTLVPCGESGPDRDKAPASNRDYRAWGTG